MLLLKGSLYRYFLALQILLSSCGSVNELIKHSTSSQFSRSVFTTYSSQKCTIEDYSGNLVKTNCENLRRLVDLDEPICQGKGKFIPKRGSFPDKDTFIQLCRDDVAYDFRNREKMTFIVVGDTGAGEHAGHNMRQLSVAHGMFGVCRSLSSSFFSPGSHGCDFVLITGDIIYPRGARDVFDSQFESRFEAMYRQFGATPFYGTLGNHDYIQNYYAQIEYTYFSDRWRMFDTFYKVPQLPKWLNIVSIDTNAIAGVEGASNNRETQLHMAENALCQSSGFNIIFGHHPSFSSGKYHGSVDDMIAFLDELTNKCSLDIYFSGHEHSQEHIVTDKYQAFIQGAGGATTRGVYAREGISQKYILEPSKSVVKYEQKYQSSSHGFALIEVTSTSLDIYLYDIIYSENPEVNASLKFGDFKYHYSLKKWDWISCFELISSNY